MNTTTVRRNTLLSAACAFALLGATAAAAAPSQKALEVMTNRAPLQGVSLPSHARAEAAISGTLNQDIFSAPALELMLPDGQKVVATLQRVAKDDVKATRSWIGTIEGAPGSVVVLSKAKGVVTGFANYKDQIVELMPAAGGRHVFYEVDQSRLPKNNEPDSVTAGAALDGSTTVETSGGAATDSGSAVVQDVLLVYTAAAASAWGQATLESNIQSAVQSAIQAYRNSGANITLNVVGLQQVALNESGSGMRATLSALEKDPAIQGLRDKLAADMVVLVSQDSDWCGYATLYWWTTCSGSTCSTKYDANAVTSSQCLSNQTLAHEIGHMQGLDHNRESAGSSAAYPYSYGYRVCGSGGFRDIMSYDCSSSTPRILNFSNPYVYYNGYATGIAYESDPGKSAEAARSLNDTATRVAGYRVSTTSPATIPVAPSSLAIQGAAYDSVTIAWSDNSSDESGFKVQRSTDGVNFAEIATLGAGSRGFTDSSVGPRATYYYRVSAYNSAGTSSFSNTASVTTPDAPPPPPTAPTSIAASANADGTASVSWTVGTTNASSFEVRRQTWNARKKAWGNAVTAATVPASVLSIVDSTGAGTFRYYVRAVNSGGVSASAGPADVTVTSGSGTSSGKKAPPGRNK